MLRLGFVGTGAISEAIVRGMQLSGGDAYAFHLSPRSEERSRALAAAYPSVTREASNEAVVAASDVVFLGVRPQDIAVLEGLPFREDQLVVTLLAGTPLARMRALAAPAARLVRVLPLPSIRHRRGPIIMTPADPLVEQLLAGLGDLIVLDKESDFAAIGSASGVMSSHFQLQATVIDWLQTKGLPPAQASLYIRSLFAGLGETGLAAARAGLSLEVEDFETPNGLNHRGRTYLRDHRWFELLTEALEAIDAHGRTLSK